MIHSTPEKTNKYQLDVIDLKVGFSGIQKKDDFSAVNGINFSVLPGERFALVGESGSGKTVTALTILRLLVEAKVSGTILWNGENILKCSDEKIRTIRGNEIAIIFQEPMSALNPLLTIGEQISEAILNHDSLSPKIAFEKSIELLDKTGVDEPTRRINSYPHQLSGGQRQRALIAMAIACKPKLLIADEPTTALDVTIRQQILSMLFSLQESEGMSILLITHDLPLVEHFADRVGVMQNGQLIEVDEKEKVFLKPSKEYTKKLLGSRPNPLNSEFKKRQVLIEARNFSCFYNISSGMFSSKRFAAVSRENFVVYRGETLGVVGESGSGKTSLGLALIRLFPGRFEGQLNFDSLDITNMNEKTLRKTRRRFQMVFQDPFSSLSPRMTILNILEEGLLLHFPQYTFDKRKKLCEEIMKEVGIDHNRLNSYPHEFSGGQRQRIAIARAVILEPDLLVLDEPTSALDVSVQAQVLDLLINLQKRRNLTYVFISHDLAVIRAVSHRILIMRYGKILEFGSTNHVLTQPRNEYTYRLMDAAFTNQTHTSES
ncbi:MAG: microcin ABC transporter ATP-binding protein [Betaproteobacteria bacterium TMED156]|nr:MAG: microcin ABC transporter ATP-binding protein [Betaproteobacteria bacterium TMED156]